MWFLIGLVVGVFVGVLVMCLMQMARDPLEAEMELRNMTADDFDKAHSIK